MNVMNHVGWIRGWMGSDFSWIKFQLNAQDKTHNTSLKYISYEIKNFLND